jgi:hypothetical protein
MRNKCEVTVKNDPKTGYGVGDRNRGASYIDGSDRGRVLT